VSTGVALTIRRLAKLSIEENPSFHGRFWQIEAGFLPSLQKPHPPVWGATAKPLPPGGRHDAWHAVFRRNGCPTSTPASRPYPRGRSTRSVGLTARASAPTDTPQAIERLKAFAEVGVSHLALELWANSIDNFREVVQRYAREVRPEVG
jgi:hypothetical protein